MVLYIRRLNTGTENMFTPIPSLKCNGFCFYYDGWFHNQNCRQPIILKRCTNNPYNLYKLLFDRSINDTVLFLQMLLRYDYKSINTNWMQWILTVYDFSRMSSLPTLRAKHGNNYRLVIVIAIVLVSAMVL